MPDAVRLTIRLDRPTAEAVRREARRLNTSVSAVVSAAVRQRAMVERDPAPGRATPITDSLAGIAAGAPGGRDAHRTPLERKHR